MAAKSKKKAAKAQVEETPTQAVPAEAGAYLAFVQATDVPEILAKPYAGYSDDAAERRADAFAGKGVSMLVHETKGAKGKRCPTTLTQIASSTRIPSEVSDMLHTRHAESTIPTGYRVDQGVVLSGRVIAPTSDDLRAIAQMVAEARANGFDSLTEKRMRSTVATLLADAAAFDEACERGYSQVIPSK